MAVADPLENQQTAIPYREPVAGTVYETRLKGAPLDPPADLDTLPKNFLYQVRKLNDKIAMRKKRYGLWQEYTWQQVYEHVTDFAMGLVSLGLSAGEAVCIIGENDPEMYWAQMAAHAMHVKTTCIFSDATPRDIIYAVTSAGGTFLVAHDQEQVDKALE
ncbi:MAG: AMP-binding protein, partial [Aggregatilineales bacterium]